MLLRILQVLAEIICPEPEPFKDDIDEIIQDGNDDLAFVLQVIGAAVLAMLSDFRARGLI